MKTLPLLVLLVGAAACSGASLPTPHSATGQGAPDTTTSVAGTSRRGARVATEGNTGGAALADGRAMDAESTGGGRALPIQPFLEVSPPAPIDTGDPMPRVAR